MNKLYETLNHFYYDVSLDELKRMNADATYQNITYNSLLYLDLIAYKKRCTPSELAAMLNVSKSAVTIKINELIKQNLVVKTQSEEDKRVFYLTIGPRVAELYDEYDSSLLKAVKILEMTYSKTEISNFCEMLEIIRKNFMRGE